MKSELCAGGSPPYFEFRQTDGFRAITFKSDMKYDQKTTTLSGTTKIATNNQLSALPRTPMSVWTFPTAAY
jgi:hypothetical protein